MLDALFIGGLQLESVNTDALCRTGGGDIKRPAQIVRDLIREAKGALRRIGQKPPGE